FFCIVVKGGAAAWSASRSQCRMEARGGRAAWRRGPRGQPHFCLATERLCGPPVGGTFWFQIFIPAPSPEVWRKTIAGGEGGCWRGSGVACFGLPPLEKIIGGVTAIVSYRPGGWMQQSTVPRCAILRREAREVLGSEAARLHHAHRRRGRVGARRAGAAGRQVAGCRLSGAKHTFGWQRMYRRPCGTAGGRPGARAAAPL